MGHADNDHIQLTFDCGRRKNCGPISDDSRSSTAGVIPRLHRGWRWHPRALDVYPFGRPILSVLCISKHSSRDSKQIPGSRCASGFVFVGNVTHDVAHSTLFAPRLFDNWNCNSESDIILRSVISLQSVYGKFDYEFGVVDTYIYGAVIFNLLFTSLFCCLGFDVQLGFVVLRVFCNYYLSFACYKLFCYNTYYILFTNADKIWFAVKQSTDWK